MVSSKRNEYLEQVLQNQRVVEDELQAPMQRKMKRRAPPPPAAAMPVQQMANFAPNLDIAAPPPAAYGGGGTGTSESRPRTDLDKALGVRITGVWPFKTVVVPPNVYVIHTRSGKERPVHVGLGLSFRFNPFTDAFLLIPATIQTILINANGICAERQGVLLQAYVQWIVDDIDTAYRKLDFSDPEDPMRVVNVQLREQAEAAMKDKISTMSIDEVLTDKRAIMEELTLRLREVAEGQKGSGGLGLKIVTVQIKEAVVSSTRVWENLQRPFRAEQEKLARLAEITSEREIRIREQAEEKEREISELSTEEELARLRHEKEIERFSREQAEQLRRAELEAEREKAAITERSKTQQLRRAEDQSLALQEMQLERERAEARLEQIRQQQAIEAAEAERAFAELKLKLEREALLLQAQHAAKLQDIERRAAEARIVNEVSRGRLESQLIAQLPQIVEHLPTPQQLKRVHISSSGQGDTPDAVSSLLGLVEGLRTLFKTEDEAAPPPDAQG